MLVPELSGSAWTEVQALVEAGVEMLRDADSACVGDILVVAHGDRDAELTYRRHDLRRWGAESVTVGPRAGASVDESGDICGSVLMAWWWISRAGLDVDVRSLVVGDGPDNFDPGIVDSSERMTLDAIRAHEGLVVVLADGPAALAPKAPIPLEQNAVALDRQLAAFVDGEGEFPRVAPAEALAYGWYSQTVWQILAAATGRRNASCAVHDAPFGVGYHLASWSTTAAHDAVESKALGVTIPKDSDDHGPTPIVLVGPTGTGKSELALDLAQELDGQIVNLDAMQLYKGMDIGTAKVPLSQRRGIAHHMFDVLDVTETASVADYQRDARAVVETLREEGKTPIIVGGSMMYYQSLLDEWNFPETDPEIRAKYEARLEAIGVHALHAELSVKDPDAAETILPTDPRRTVRALEVIELTGKPFAASRPTIGRPRWDAVILALDVETEELDARLEQRTAAMFEQGLVDEVRHLVSIGLNDGVTARRAIGYAQVLDMLADAGDAEPTKAALDEAVYRTFVGTRRYVRRQRSWFRRDDRITWLDANARANKTLLNQARRIVGERS